MRNSSEAQKLISKTISTRIVRAFFLLLALAFISGIFYLRFQENSTRRDEALSNAHQALVVALQSPEVVGFSEAIDAATEAIRQSPNPMNPYPMFLLLEIEGLEKVAKNSEPPEKTHEPFQYVRWLLTHKKFPEARAHLELLQQKGDASTKGRAELHLKFLGALEEEGLE